MDAPADEQINEYMECLKSEIGELETCLQNGTTIKQLCIASKRVVFAAAQLDEMILRSLTSERKYPPTQTACELSPPALRRTHSDTEHQQTSNRFAVGSRLGTLKRSWTDANWERNGARTIRVLTCQRWLTVEHRKYLAHSMYDPSSRGLCKFRCCGYRAALFILVGGQG